MRDLITPRNRVFLIFSVGLVAVLSSYDITFATVTVCCSSGAFTQSGQQTQLEFDRKVARPKFGCKGTIY